MIACHLKNVLLVVVLLMGVCTTGKLTAQSKPVALKEALRTITRTYGTQFVYDQQLLEGKTTTYNLGVLPPKGLEEALKNILYPNDLVFIYVKPNYYTIVAKDNLTQAGGEAGRNNTAAAGTTTAAGKERSSSHSAEITGMVTDSIGKGIPNVTVSERGTTHSTASGGDGSFTLSVASPQAVLVFSSVGYTSREVPLTGQTHLNVQLNQVNAALGEVVVIGYGSQKRANVTSAVATVKAEDFVKGPVLDAGQLLQGKVAGLSVGIPSGDPTSGSQILLRGSTTLLGANANPLILIDGIPGDLKTVAPEDIESVDVLKDGSAAAIYGVRGTNGVIIITTRRASGNNINTVEYSGYASTQTIVRKLDMLTAADYRQQIKDGVRAATWDLGSNTDWMKEITQTPLTHVHNLTFRGGNSRTNYLANLNYRYLEGIFKKSDNATFTGRVDVNHTLFDDKLKVNFGILNATNTYTTTGDGFSFNGYTYRQALIRNPTSPVYDSTGKWFEQPGIFNYENPLARLFESDGQNTSQNTRFNGSLNLTPFRGLRLNALFSYTRFNQERGYAETKRHISTLRDARNGFASVGSAQSIDRLMELTAEYTRKLSDHRFTLLGGYSYQDNQYRNMWMQNWDFPTDLFTYNNIGLGNALRRGLAPEYSTKTETNLIGFFGRVTYSYKERYLLMANLRHEAASQLYGARKPWGTFPAASIGWRIINEPFMQRQTLFDDLKLRAGYGVTGTQPSNLFLGVAILGYNNYVYSNGTWIQTLGPTQNPNPDLRWEEKHETNLGLDFSMFKGRISGNVDYYVRRIKGLLFDYQVPSPPNLYPSTRANVGTMENKGLEILLNLVPVRTRNLVWNSSFNFSTNSNKLVSLSNDLYRTTNNYFTAGGTGEPIQTFTHIVNVGDKIGDFYGFKVIDITEDGKWIYEGRDGKPVTYGQFQHAFEDKRVLGNGLPKYYAGWNNNLRYRNLDLSVTMRGAFGYQILNFQRMYYENTNLQQYNRLKSAYDKVFNKAVLSKDMPLEFNSYYIEDGDFWKIDNITAGYNFSKTRIPFVRAARVYVSTLNTFIITGYKGIDPEVNRLGLSPGNDDRDKYPTTRTFTLGINLNF